MFLSPFVIIIFFRFFIITIFIIVVLLLTSKAVRYMSWTSPSARDLQATMRDFVLNVSSSRFKRKGIRTETYAKSRLVQYTMSLAEALAASLKLTPEQYLETAKLFRSGSSEDMVLTREKMKRAMARTNLHARDRSK